MSLDISLFEDKIAKQVFSSEGNTLLEKISNYSNKLGNEPKILQSRDIDDRLKTHRYFYFPSETESYNLNCFEKSAAIYFALRKLVPEKNPKLLFINEGKRGVHATTIFFENGEMHVADPNYNFFGPAIIQDNEIILRNEEDQKLKFESYSVIDDNNLEKKIHNLRQKSGIVEFFSGAGQIAKINTNFKIPYIIFGKVNDYNTIRFEYRMINFDTSLQICKRFNYDPHTKNLITQMLTYSYDNWDELINERILFSTKPFKIEDKKIEFDWPKMSFKDFGKVYSENIYLYSKYISCLTDKINTNKKKISSTYLFEKMIDEEIKFDKKNNPELIEWTSNISNDFVRRNTDYYIFLDTYPTFLKEEYGSVQKSMKNIHKTANSLVQNFLAEMFDNDRWCRGFEVRQYSKEVKKEIEKLI